MKKKILMFGLIAVSFITKAQLNFQFQVLNSANTVILPTVSCGDHNIVEVVNLDLTSTTCEGDLIKIRNLSNGTYSSPAVTLTSSSLWDAAWGYWYLHPYGGMRWNALPQTFLKASTTWIGNDLNVTVPIGDPVYPTVYLNPGVPSSGQITLPSINMTTSTMPTNVAYKYILLTPRLSGGNGYNHLDQGEYATGCGSKVIALRIKVKKGPKPISVADVCSGTVTTVTVQPGTTITNWVPSNPTVTPVTTPGSYTVSLSAASGCSATQTLTINGKGTQLAPSITGATTLCNSSQATYIGFDASGYGYESKWEVFQSNFMGTQGALQYSGTMNDINLNANFTLPNTLGTGYFMIKYTVHGYNEEGCELTKVVQKIIYKAPWIIAGFDGETNVCLGSSTTLCAAVPQGFTVNWSFTGIRSANVTTPCVTLTPTTSTTGTIKLTHTQSGCITTSTFPITVLANNANLSATATANSGGSTITISVDPSVPNPLPAGYQSYYVVEKLTGTNGTTVAGTQTPNSYATAPLCWKDKITPSTLSEYNGVSSVTCGVNGSVPNGIYKITRYVRNANCDWTSASVQVGGTGRFANFASSEENELTIHSDLNAIAFPNPTSGLVKIDSKETVKTIHITTITGALVKDVQNETEVDLNNYPSGMYFFTIITKNGKQTIKVIKE